MNGQNQPSFAISEEQILTQLQAGVNSFRGLCEKLSVSRTDPIQNRALDKALQRLRRAKKITFTRTGWEIVN